jgi:hypothetical protein
MHEATAPTPESSRIALFRRPGFNNIAPYFLAQGAPRFLDFLVVSFEGTERIRVPTVPSCTPRWPSAMRTSLSWATPASNIPRAQ